jgi:hypothetical protein
MNKRNTYIAIIVLVVLVMLLFTRGCVYRHTWLNHCTVEIKEQAVCKKDLKPLESIDLKDCNYPIVIHYKEPNKFDDVYTKNHIIGLTWNALDSCPPMPDSIDAIHIYIQNSITTSKNIYLGLYFKTSMKEEVEYKLTYPANDNRGLHLATDSGKVITVLHWKAYGMDSPTKFRRQADDMMTKKVEENLLKNVLKKMSKDENN